MHCFQEMYRSSSSQWVAQNSHKERPLDVSHAAALPTINEWRRNKKIIEVSHVGFGLARVSAELQYCVAFFAILVNNKEQGVGTSTTAGAPTAAGTPKEGDSSSSRGVRSRMYVRNSMGVRNRMFVRNSRDVRSRMYVRKSRGVRSHSDARNSRHIGFGSLD